MTRYFLACRLKYSRWTWVIFTDNMRQETLFRGLVACFNALGFVPWVLVFDNMKTVTTGRDDQQQPIWHRSLLQLAAEFDFHPEACWPASGNQKGSVESLVKFVKINFLAGRSFINDADLQAQCRRVAGLRQHHAAVTGHRRDASVAAGGGGRQGVSLAEDRRRLRLRRARPGEQWCVGGRARQQLFGAHRARRRAGHGAHPPRRASSSGTTRNGWLSMPVRQTEPTAVSSTRPTLHRCSGASRGARSCCTARHSWAWVASLSST